MWNPTLSSFRSVKIWFKYWHVPCERFIWSLAFLYACYRTIPYHTFRYVHYFITCKHIVRLQNTGMRLRHTRILRHSIFAFRHVVLWVRATTLWYRHAAKRNYVIWQWREHVRLTNMTLNDVTTSELPSVHQNLYLLSFSWRQNTRNLLGKTDESKCKKFWRSRDWHCLHLQGDAPEDGERISLRNVVIFLNFDMAVYPRRFQWPTKLVF